MAFWDGIAGGIVAGAASLFGQERANQQNAGLAREQMAFQERMSGTAHQREVADLRAAGLNPDIICERRSFNASRRDGSYGEFNRSRCVLCVGRNETQEGN